MSKEPTLFEFSKTFQQEADCCDSNGPLQMIDVKQEDGGGGPFWVIETERWAFCSIDEVVALLHKAGVPQRRPYPDQPVAAVIVHECNGVQTAAGLPPYQP